MLRKLLNKKLLKNIKCKNKQKFNTLKTTKKYKM